MSLKHRKYSISQNSHTCPIDWSRVPKQIEFKGVVASPNDWCQMIGIRIYEFIRKANELRDWSEACDIKYYQIADDDEEFNDLR